MAAKTVTKKATPKAKTAPLLPKQTQTTLVAKAGGGKTHPNSARNKPKLQGPANGNIMAFFKKADDINNRIFLQERGSNPAIELDGTEEEVGWSDEVANGVMTFSSDNAERYNENGGSNKKRKLSQEMEVPACSPPPPEAASAPAEALSSKTTELAKPRSKSGPFVDDSDDDDEAEEQLISRRGTIK